MTRGGGQPGSGVARPVGGLSTTPDLLTVWELLEKHPRLRGTSLPVAALVEGLVSA